MWNELENSTPRPYSIVCEHLLRPQILYVGFETCTWLFGEVVLRSNHKNCSIIKENPAVLVCKIVLSYLLFIQLFLLFVLSKNNDFLPSIFICFILLKWKLSPSQMVEASGNICANDLSDCVLIETIAICWYFIDTLLTCCSFFPCSRNLQYVWRCGDSTPGRYNLVWTSSKTPNPVSCAPIVHSAEVGHQVRPREPETRISVRAGFSTQEGVPAGLGLQTTLCILQRSRVGRGVVEVFRSHQQETLTTSEAGSVRLGERPRCQRATADL